ILNVVILILNVVILILNVVILILNVAILILNVAILILNVAILILNVVILILNVVILILNVKWYRYVSFYLNAINAIFIGNKVIKLIITNKSDEIIKEKKHSHSSNGLEVKKIILMTKLKD
ncbi:hypothetical protein CDIK_3014, partial [Cucumispora dikerogammari]